jgi:Transposase DDE domain
LTAISSSGTIVGATAIILAEQELMDATWILTAFVLIDTLMEHLEHRTDVRAQVPVSQVILIAVLSAKYFANQHERAVCILRESGYLSGWIALTRFNRRLQKLADWLSFIATSLGEIGLKGQVCVIDRLPVPVCRRVRARRCKKVRGREYCGYCAAKKEKFFGWRLHLICTPCGMPLSFQLVPAAFHDLTPLHELAVVLPPGARLFGDKA